MSTTITKASCILAGSVLIAMLGLLLTNELTKDRIHLIEKRTKNASLMEVLPQGIYDSGPLDNAHQIQAGELSPTSPVEVYPIYKNGRPFAAALTLVAHDGYNGSINLLLGLTADGTVIAARVLSHQETPGLGDDIEIKRSNWINAFRGTSLDSHPEPQWTVSKEGGAFDAFTGATITPRAVIKAIHRALVWYEVSAGRVYIHEQ